MLTDPKTEVARVREVLLAQLVLLDFETSFEDFLGFGSAHGDVHCDLLVASDAEGADCVAGFAWLLSVLLSSSCGGSGWGCWVHRGGDEDDRGDDRVVNVLYTGVCPLNCSNTFAALVNRSPLSPTEMFNTSLSMRSSRMGFELLSVPSAIAMNGGVNE
jgi:hypothetical protein